jgi:hypothetical protein
MTCHFMLVLAATRGYLSIGVSSHYTPDVRVRRWYYYRDRYCKATEVEERAGRRLVLRQIATLGSHLVRTIDIHAAKSLLA